MIFNVPRFLKFKKLIYSFIKSPPWPREILWTSINISISADSVFKYLIFVKSVDIFIIILVMISNVTRPWLFVDFYFNTSIWTISQLSPGSLLPECVCGFRYVLKVWYTSYNNKYLNIYGKVCRFIFLIYFSLSLLFFFSFFLSFSLTLFESFLFFFLLSLHKHNSWIQKSLWWWFLRKQENIIYFFFCRICLQSFDYVSHKRK